jgi:ATP-dependent protease ClpP protease subunit
MTTTRKVALLFCLLVSTPAHGMLAELAGKRAEFKHVVKVYGTIDLGLAATIEFNLSQEVPRGDVLVLINSGGGYTHAGDRILDSIKAFAGKHRVVCLGISSVGSMAFNIMSNCDARYSVPETSFLMHDPYTLLPCKREDGLCSLTLRELHSHTDDLERDALRYREVNRKALNLTRSEINALCERGDTTYTPKELIENGYLNGSGRILR